ncbi:hypothetical protein BGZ80_011734 [Entomortierella chlamydospora]|uniref:HCP-like protein n=1 Tax=Entomortierella chlamydospora TaxID=101097 RepID=A0A9P6SZ23_9FUNG|nr:hypothetical protein BGZ80_011734 [Entomortierella chlamydospora]
MPQSRQEVSHQAFRPVHRCNETGHTLPLSDRIKIKYRFDKMLGQYIILWNDILTVFSDAMHVRNGDTAVEYLTDENFEFLQPLRIGAYPGIVLDVIIKLPEYSPISESPKAHSKSTYPSAASSNFHDIKCHPTIADELGKSSMPSPRPPDHTPQVALENESCTVIRPVSNNEDIIEDRSLDNMSSAQGQVEVDLKAIYDQGLAHYDGKGVPQDYLKASKYFLNTATAIQGCRKSQCDLRDMYCDGKRVLQDYKVGLYWYGKAADQNCPVAQYNIGSMHIDHKTGVIRGHMLYGVAAEWYRKSASQGYAKAQYMLGSLLSGGEGAGPYRPGEAFPNEAFGRFVGAAYQGCAKSQYNVGLMYDSGMAVLLNYSRAIEWFGKSASEGYAPAQYHLGLKYQGVAQNDKIAVMWYREAADQGYAEAQYQLGRMYELGQGVAHDLLTAAEWYRKASSQGNNDAKWRLENIPKNE